MRSRNYIPVSNLNFNSGRNHPPIALGTQATDSEIELGAVGQPSGANSSSCINLVLTTQSELHGFRQVEGFPSSGLENLLPATESVRDNQCVLRRVAHRREKDSLADRLRHVVLIFLETKGSRHSTASRIDRLQIG